MPVIWTLDGGFPDLLGKMWSLYIFWHSQIPTIGAIAGVMGAYFILYPKAKMLTLVPIFFFFQFLEIQAFLFLGVWFLFQFLSAVGMSAHGGVALPGGTILVVSYLASSS